MSGRFLFTTWEGGGNVPPVLSVARALRARGHHVRVMADGSLAGEIEAAGLEPVPYTTAPTGEAASASGGIVRDHEARTPIGAFARARDRLVCGAAGAYAQDTLAELRRSPADVLAADCMLLGTHVAGEAAQVPVASLVHLPYPFPTAGAPPFGPGLPPARGPVGHARDRVVAALVTKPWDKGLPALNAARAAHGLTPVSSVMDAFTAPERLIVLSPRALDYAGRTYPPHVRFAGPRLDDPAWVQEPALPDGDAPLVLVGFSSTFMDQRSVLGRVAAALGRLPVRGLVTTGPAVDPATVPAPRSVRVVRSAAHSAVLPRTAVAVTHAGHGTVTKALAAGVPLVCMPLGRDQHEVARRVAVAGAGVTIGPRASAARIAGAVRTVLEDPSYRRAARRLAAAIAEELSRDAAVDELEAMAGARG
jgi:MGT family glycosyltransferase